MTITQPAPPLSVDRVKQLLEAGNTVEDVATAASWPRQRIVALINGWKGWLHDHERDVAYQPDRRPVRPAPASKPAASAAAQPPAPNPTAPTSASPGVASVAELITRAADMDDKPVQRALQRVTEALARLRSAVADVDQRAEQERQRKAAQEQIAELERELAAARARARELGATRSTPRKTTASPVSAKAIRAWAEQAGVECNSHGRVPKSVVDQYLAANGAA